MKIHLIFLSTLFSLGAVSSYKCDEKIVERIQKLWEKHADRDGGLLKEVNIIIFVYNCHYIESKYTHILWKTTVILNNL